MRYFLVILFFLAMPMTWAAPHPATSSSFLVGQDNGRFISQHGFLLNSAKTSWLHKRTPKGVKHVETMYLAPKSERGMRASLTVRVDDLSSSPSLKSYMKKWAKDYHRFGFDILASQKVKVGNYKAHMVDLRHNPSDRQLRQVVFVKRKKAVIFTCRDHIKSFLKSLKSCNEIVRSFRWTES